MPIIGSTWTGLVSAQMATQGMVGPNVPDFATAVGSGSASHVVGASFGTSDIGVVAGTGVGIGVGIVVAGPAIASAIYGYASGYGWSGPNLMNLCTAVGNACSIALLSALLSSTHSPIFSGTGTVISVSIGVIGGTWGGAIQSAFPFTGPQWANMCQAIGKGCADVIHASAVAIVSITGVGAPGTPGVGSGIGAIT